MLLLVFQILQTFCRSARGRYYLAFITLLAMAAALPLTYEVLRLSSGTPNDGQATASLLGSAFSHSMFATSDVRWLSWLVIFWVFGVALLSLRIFGGWYAGDSPCRRHTAPLPASLLTRCQHLCGQLAVSQSVRFFQPALVNVPTVVGWLRPVVLIPTAALLRLTPSQLEAVIIHEIAHVRRLDVLANIIQMGVETVLFYHPAVWWISHRIRVEREHCCDDVAVSLTGDALGYAKVLATLEELRGLPEPALAANGGLLKQRILRLLGLSHDGNTTSTVNIFAISFVCLFGFFTAYFADVNQDSALRQEPALANTPTVTRLRAVVALAPPDLQNTIKPAALSEDVKPHDVAAEAGNRARHMQERDERSPVYDGGELRPQKNPKVSAAYVRDLRETWSKVSASQIAALKAHGITEDDVRSFRLDWPDISVNDVIAMRLLGVSATEALEYKKVGLSNLTARLVYAYKTAGVTPEYVSRIRSAGINLKDVLGHHLVAYRVTGVTPELIKELQSMGIEALTPSDYITAQVRGLTPEFLAEVRKHNFRNLNLRSLIGFKNTGAFG